MISGCKSAYMQTSTPAKSIVSCTDYGIEFRSTACTFMYPSEPAQDPYIVEKSVDFEASITPRS